VRRTLIQLLLSGLVAEAAWGADCRFTLADQSDWNNQLGFYLALENSSSSSAPCPLASLKIALGVAGGGAWRFIVQTPNWQLNQDYTATAVIAPDHFELRLNGQLLARSYGPFTPKTGQAVWANTVPSWANAAAAYQTLQTGVKLESTDGLAASISFATAQLSPPIMLLAGGVNGASLAWNADATKTWTVTTTFRLLPAVSPSDYYPMIDRYGQAVAADWPAKIRSDSDLTAATALEHTKLEAWGVPSGYDAYGGVLDAPWKEQGTGYYRITQRGGMYWLVTPEGNPCFYIGLDTAPALTWDRTPVTGRADMFAELPASGAYSEAWGLNSWGQNDGTADISFNTVNMIRKYGDNWRATEQDLAVRRMKAWGFSGIGKWGDFMNSVPIMPVLSRSNTPSLSRHPDVFDASVQATFRADLANQINPRRTDPFVVGWSLGNEYDEIITTAETSAVLGMSSAVAAKRAFVDEALASTYAGDVAAMARAWGIRAATRNDLYAATNAAPPSADLEHLRQFYARAYYGFIYQTVKNLDPNHLYFGFWITPGWWENENDWRLIAPYCDAIGYDRYSDLFVEPYLDRLIRETAKPILLGEFSFPADYGLERGFRRYGVSAADDAQSGSKYSKWLDAAARNPWCIGVGWFQYRDEPVSGRGPGQGSDPVYGENFAFGMVDVGDRPKYDLVEQARTANLGAAQKRLTFQPPAVYPGGAVNAASFAAGAPVAPGSLIAIFGDNLDGATLRMDDFDAPILYSSQGQINAQVPWELAGQTTAQLVASNGNAIDVPLATYSPGIFVALPASARRGDYLTIYCNGLGPVSNQPATGERSPLLPLAETLLTPVVTIGNAPARVTYSGLTPTLIGLYQVNVQVPDDAPTGKDLPLQLQIGGATANRVAVTIE
jgi:uncharacterized protein (TIGR03437 family)